ncbi:MAG: MFS transporter [Clostridia bacterium]|nr:MFS transporter [Clostridia bacterium]
MTEIKNKILSLLVSLKTNWKTPPKGRYIPFKEIASLAFGGIGVKFIVYCVSNMIISIGNGLIGNTIGIDPSAMYVIYIISVLSGFPLTALRARMIDNTKGMKGKYRPYIISMGIPTVILGIGFIWMPYEHMSLSAKCISVLLFNIGFQFFYNFMTDAYDSLTNVLSPNTIERTDVYAVKSVVENLSPSIASIFLPLVARAITGDNTLYDLKVYRVLYPPMLIVGFAISLLVYVNTQERIVKPKNHVVQISFWDSFRAVARNKYFWIISLAGWIGFLESSFNTIMGWMYNYQSACSAGQYSLIVAISGNASLWPNLFAPYLIRKYGKKKVLILSNILNIIFIATMLPVIRMEGVSVIWLLLVFTFINQLLTSLGHFMNPSLNADIRDYQQYISGERIDGMFSAVGLIGSVITLATSSVLPAIYESAGLNRQTALMLGYDGSNVYDVLYNREYFVHICSVLVVASIVGAALNVIPFFFYDLTETKQRAMVKVLKIRAMFEDYAAGTLSDASLSEAVEIIEEARLYYGREPNILSKEKIKEARKSKDKQLLHNVKEEQKLLREENEKIETAEFIINELNRFTTPEGAARIENCRAVVAAGLNGFVDSSLFNLKQAKAMPKATAFEKEARRNAISAARDFKIARKTAQKYYPEGLTEFDSGVFADLFKADDETQAAVHEVLAQMKAAKESGNKEHLTELKTELEKLRIRERQIKLEIKKATRLSSIYNRAAKPYIKAQRTLTQSECYIRYEEIAAKYAELNQ